LQSNVFNTRFVGHHFVKLIKVDSTNNYLKSLLSNSKPLSQGTVIMADEQFAGRGQNNQKWVSQAGKNLTFSFYLQPQFLAASNQFKLNQVVALGITDCLTKILGNSCKIKWPNDIYYNDDKIGGILIENKVRGYKISESVIGIGLNVNQIIFDNDLKNPNSIANILGVNYELMPLLGNILLAIEKRYDELEVGNTELDEIFIKRLFKLNQKCQFYSDDQFFYAKIVGVSDTGLLLLATDEGLKQFNLKEVEMVF